MRKKSLYLLLAISSSLALFSCTKNSDDNGENSGTTPNGEVSNSLHLSFTTPDWNRFIDCSLLDLNPIGINATTTYFAATSASTRESFNFSLPKDSSKMVLASNLKKYSIKNFGQNAAPFEFSQKVPITDGNATYLISSGGAISDSSYNEVTEIKYVGNETNYALWQVKCRYKMMAYELGNTANRKPITGTFHFKVRTTKL